VTQSALFKQDKCEWYCCLGSRKISQRCNETVKRVPLYQMLLQIILMQ